MLRTHLYTVALGLLLAPGTAPGQEQPDSLAVRQLHDEVARLIAGISRRRLPSGDTLVTWAKQGPILYHTVCLGDDSVASSMIRNDSLVGETVTHWAQGQPTSFATRWTRGDSTLVSVRGDVVGAELHVSGSRSVDLSIPALPWAVADYGMYDQLLPQLLGVPADRMPHRVAVLRPYVLRWDTLTVTAERAGDLLRIRETGSQNEREVILVYRRSAILVVGENQTMQRRPLEGTVRYAELMQLLNAQKDRR